MIRIMIVDDHPLFREGVSLSLDKYPDIEVVSEADRAEEAIRKMATITPDLVLMDIDMPGLGGMEGLRIIMHRNPDMKVMMLTVSENEADLVRAIRSGARGYVLKGATAQQLADAVRVVADGDVYITPTLAGGILFEMTYDEGKETDPLRRLTDRESQILSLVAQGLTNREIADRLSLAEKTVKHYLTGVFQKLQVRSRVEAALLARDSESKTGDRQ